MAKKDFSDTKNRVHSSIAEVTQDISDAQDIQEAPATRSDRRTYNEQEALEYMNRHETAGRKGLKLPRINMAFTPENYNYIMTMARVRGETLTTFVNRIIDQSREENNELYQRAVEFRKQFL